MALHKYHLPLNDPLHLDASRKYVEAGTSETIHKVQYQLHMGFHSGVVIEWLPVHPTE